jgi:hypothetical protein
MIMVGVGTDQGNRFFGDGAYGAEQVAAADAGPATR